MKTLIMQIRLQPKEKEAFEKSAEIAGISLSSWVRERLRLAAVRELESAGLPIPFIERVPVRLSNHE